MQQNEKCLGMKTIWSSTEIIDVIWKKKSYRFKIFCHIYHAQA